MKAADGNVLICTDCKKELSVDLQDAGWTDYGQGWVRKYSRLKCLSCAKFYCYSWFKKVVIANECLEEGEVPILFNPPEELFNPPKNPNVQTSKP